MGKEVSAKLSNRYTWPHTLSVQFGFMVICALYNVTVHFSETLHLLFIYLKSIYLEEIANLSLLWQRWPSHSRIGGGITQELSLL